MERMAMIKTVAEQVDNLKQGHKVDLSNPDRTILVELFKVRLLIYLLFKLERLTSDLEHGGDIRCSGL